MSEPERTPDPLVELVARVVTLDEPESGVARRAFLERAGRERSRARPDRSWLSSRTVRLGVPLAAAALVVATLFVLREPKLEFVVVGAKSEGGYVRVPEGRPATVEFSDRTRLVAFAGSALRVDDEESVHGARVSVESGRIGASVTHTGQSNWRFVAGPFQVRVTGTRFDLSWDAERERLEVELHEGSVEIEGYQGSGKLDVRAGQRFVGDARGKTMLVAALGAPLNRTESSLAEPSSASNGETEARSGDEPSLGEARDAGGTNSADDRTRQGSAKAPTSRDGAGAPRESWAKLVSKGAFSSVVTAAESRGVADCLAACSLADLSAVADAARYVGRADLAEKALRALRARDAGGSGSRAAFLLGRLQEGRGDLSGAKSWYETSLRESPSGSFAGEALAGRMRTTHALAGAAAARPLAAEYLRRFPSGVHAALARQLSESR